MKKYFLTMLAALCGTAMIAKADLQFEAGPLYAIGDEDESWGLDLGAGLYFEHHTSFLASALMARYMYIGDIDTETLSISTTANYHILGADYRLYIPMLGDQSLQGFVTGTVGAARTNASASTLLGGISSTDWGLAWGVGGGLLWKPVPNFGVQVGYTYLGLDEPSIDGFSLGEGSLHLVRFGGVFRF